MNLEGSRLHAALRNSGLAEDDILSDSWQTPLDQGPDLYRAYVRFRASTPLSPHVIVYETMSGDRMNDNPYAIFEYLRAHPTLGPFLHVWSLGPHGEISPQYAEAEDVVFVPRDSLAFAYFLASARLVICNAILPDYFARREGQLYLNTWHGIPFKTLGRNIGRARYGHPVSVGTFLKATHIVTPCEFMTERLILDFSMSGASTAQIAETGYPRVDLTVNTTPEQASALRGRLGIVEEAGRTSHRPVVLFAPTWRDGGGHDAVDLDQLRDDLDGLARLDIQLVYRGHHRADRIVRDEEIGDSSAQLIVPPHDLSSNELLSVVDILVTDYSSIFFDFLPTGRPIVHYLYDLEEYARTRGLNLSPEELPGAVATSREALVDAVAAQAVALRDAPSHANFATAPLQGEPYRLAQRRFAPHEDGKASARAVEFLLSETTPRVDVISPRDGRPTVAFWAGTLRKGPESEAFLRRAISFATSPNLQVTLVLDRASFVAPTTVRALRALGTRLAVLPHDLREITTLPEEASAVEEFSSSDVADARELWRRLRRNPVLAAVYQREYERLLDDCRFDALFLAPDLELHEIALAGFASKRRFSLGAANKIERSRMPRIRRPLHVLLPRGSRRRAGAERLYHLLRRS